MGDIEEMVESNSSLSKLTQFCFHLYTFSTIITLFIDVESRGIFPQLF